MAARIDGSRAQHTPLTNLGEADTKAAEAALTGTNEQAKTKRPKDRVSTGTGGDASKLGSGAIDASKLSKAERELLVELGGKRFVGGPKVRGGLTTVAVDKLAAHNLAELRKLGKGKLDKALALLGKLSNKEAERLLGKGPLQGLKTALAQHLHEGMRDTMSWKIMAKQNKMMALSKPGVAAAMWKSMANAGERESFCRSLGYSRKEAKALAQRTSLPEGIPSKIGAMKRNLERAQRALKKLDLTKPAEQLLLQSVAGNLKDKITVTRRNQSVLDSTFKEIRRDKAAQALVDKASSTYVNIAFSCAIPGFAGFAAGSAKSAAEALGSVAAASDRRHMAAAGHATGSARKDQLQAAKKNLETTKKKAAAALEADLKAGTLGWAGGNALKKAPLSLRELQRAGTLSAVASGTGTLSKALGSSPFVPSSMKKKP